MGCTDFSFPVMDCTVISSSDVGAVHGFWTLPELTFEQSDVCQNKNNFLSAIKRVGMVHWAVSLSVRVDGPLDHGCLQDWLYIKQKASSTCSLTDAWTLTCASFYKQTVKFRP